MSRIVRLRALALSSLLALTPVLPIGAEPPKPAAAQEADAAGALFAQVEARPAISPSPFDAAGLNAAMGDFAKLSWAASRTDAATGAARLTGVRFELQGDTPQTLFTADEMLVWNMDTKALADRQKGKRLGETLRLFDRVELVGVSLDLTDYNQTVTDAIEGALPSAAAGSTEYGESRMTVGRVILGGLTLHPWTFREAEGQEEGLAAIRLLSAIARAFSLEDLAMIDSDAVQTLVEGGALMTMNIDYGRQLIQGYDRGDIASMIQTGVSFDGLVTVPETAPALTPVSAGTAEQIEMSGAMGYSSWSGLRLSKLLEYGERGEMPPISERDLWSLGNYTITDTQMSFGGKPFFEIGRLDMSADKFAWLIPERLTFEHQDASFSLSNLLKVAETIEPEAAPAAGEPSITQIISILDRTGLGTLSGDGSFALTWNSQTGDTLMSSKGVADRLYADETRLAMRLPSYAQLIPAFGAGGKVPDEKALEALFEKEFEFSGGHLSLTDTGLLDAVAALTIEIAKISGEDDPMLANFATSTPEGVRSFFSGMVMLGGGAVASELPEANGWIAGFSRFLTSGGTFTVRLAPERALTAAELDTLDAGAELDPSAFVKLLGLTMTHTPPAAPAADAP